MKNGVVVQLRLTRGVVTVAALVLALALGLAAVGTVFAQDTTTINGCYANKSGALRVVNSAGACKSGETPISWNQQGPKGEQGLQGDPGANGADGPNGQDGKTVLNGSGAPAAGLGSEGDFYIDTSTNEIYGPKTTNGWGSPTSLVGPPDSGGDADTLDTLDSTDFLRATGKAADADKLDGQDSTAFASASHNHDSSYIQQSPGTAEDASINITGTMRTSGMLRTGSETGTSQLPSGYLSSYNGLVVRRIVSQTRTAA